MKMIVRIGIAACLWKTKSGRDSLRVCRLLAVWILLLLFVPFRPDLRAEVPRKVLLISSYHPGFPTFFEQVNGIKSILEPRSVLLDIECMDSKRFDNPINRSNFYHTLSYKLSQIGDDYEVVLAGDDNALTFVLQHQQELFENKPIVFFGVNDVELALKQNANPMVTGVIEAVSMRDTIHLMLKLDPKARHIIALCDSTPSGRADLKTFYKMAPEFDSVNFSDISLSDLSFDEFVRRLRGLKGDSAVLLLSAYRDKNGKTLLFHESLELIRKNLTHPLYHLWYHGLGDGVLGGKVISHYQQGKTAALLAEKVLGGALVKELPVISQSPNQYVFDYRELKRFGFNLSDLPEGSRIINRPDSFYARHKHLIWSIVGLLGGFGILVLVMGLNILHRRQVENKLSQLNQQLEQRVKDRTAKLQEANSALQKSLKTLKSAQAQLVMREKMAALGELVAGVAHEISTPLGIGVTGASFLDQKTQQLSALMDSESMTRSDLEKYIKSVLEVTASILANLTRAAELVKSFKQVAVDQASEEPRKFCLKNYLDEVLLSLRPKYKRTRHVIEVNCPQDIELFSYPGAFSQIVTNLVINTLIHGFKEIDQGKITLDATVEQNRLHLRYMDNGRGIQPDVVQKIYDPFFTTQRDQGCSGLGMYIVYNLVTQTLGGKIECFSSVGKGIEFQITIPLSEGTR